MKPRTLLILALVVAVLGAFIGWVERDLPGSEERTERAGRLFGGLEEADVASLEVERAGGDFLLERRSASAGSVAASNSEDSETRWWLVEPFDYRAAGERVEPFVQALLTLESTRALEASEVDEESLGLTDPEAILHLTSLGGEGGPWTLRVGRQMPLGNQRVVRLETGDDSWTHLVSGSFLDQLPNDAGTLRERRLVPVEATEVDRLVIERGGERVVLERDENAPGFRLTTPVEDRADRLAVQELARTLAGLRVERFVDDTALENVAPATTIEITGRDSAVVRLEIGQPLTTGSAEGSGGAADDGGFGESAADSRYGRSAGQGVVFSAADLGVQLERPVVAWRSHAWAGIPAFDIDRVVVREPMAGGAPPLSLERRDGVWFRTVEDDGASVEVELTATPVNDFLYALADAEGVAVDLDAAQPEEGAALRVFELTGEGFERTLTQGAPRPDGTALGWASDRRPAVVLPPEVLAGLSESLGALRRAPAMGEEGETEDEAQPGAGEAEASEADP